jgi:hypothetical protein
VSPRWAVFLADLFVAGKVDHLYAADTRRAQQTAAPIANQFGLPINLLASSDWPTLAGRIKSDHRGQTVVVVGYASTLPIVLEQLTGTRADVVEGEYGSDVRRGSAESGPAPSAAPALPSAGCAERGCDQELETDLRRGCKRLSIKGKPRLLRPPPAPT